jgi:CYTH domain-containing protein
MPTEHEFKFMLRNSDEVREAIRRLSVKQQVIEQGYLVFSKGNSARIRHLVCDGKKKWFFTFKHKVAGRVVELEHVIETRDAEDLWRDCMGKLKKTRHILEDKKGRKWEVDFFFNLEGGCYFVMAELELPEGEPAPSDLPRFIKDHLIYDVPLTDRRFSNKKLGDVNYATKLYASLVHKGDTK